MGGIVAGTDGRTSLPGLLALGEASCTGVHGANRLASNSLLEGLVFGLDAADRLATGETMTGNVVRDAGPPSGSHASVMTSDRPLSTSEIDDLRHELQRTMSRNVSVLRDADGLAEAAETIHRLHNDLPHRVTGPAERRDIAELWNMLDAAGAIVGAARQRDESRGAHARSDFPEPNHDWDGRHSILIDGQRGHWKRGALSTALPDPVSYSQ